MGLLTVVFSHTWWGGVWCRGGHDLSVTKKELLGSGWERKQYFSRASRVALDNSMFMLRTVHCVPLRDKSCKFLLKYQLLIRRLRLV